jgi:serine/threonine-protein kinase
MSQQPGSGQGAGGQRLRPFKPQRFGRYTLLMPISTGGMGEIFLARLEGSHGFDKLCVIKKILPHLAEDQDFVERFVDEARILVKLSHGNIAQVLDMGVHEGAPYIALEFVDGKDLRRVLGRMRDRGLQIPLSFVLYTMTRVLDALAYAHRKRGDDDAELNLVHRDVSPQNVLISYEGEVKVIDFGLAKSTLSSSKTNPSIIMGKFLYMAPEQARHQKVDRRSDLYAVGLCLYELVTGKNPFDDVPPGEVMAKVANPDVRPLSELDPLCPMGLSDAVAKALSPDPANRFATAEEFRAKLLALLLEIDPAAGPETAARFMREAFAVEHHAERKMLAALRDQARGLSEEVPAEEAPAEAPAPAPAPAAAPAPPQAVSAPAVTVEAMPAVVPPPPSSAPPRASPVRAESLSFQPTRKGGAPAPARKGAEGDRGTLPSIVLDEGLADAPAPLPPPRAKGRDFEPTEQAVPMTPSPSAPGPTPSIVVEGLDVEPEPKPKAAAARTTGQRAQVKRPPATGERKKSERPAPKPSAKAANPTPPAPAPVKAAAPPARAATSMTDPVLRGPPPTAPKKGPGLFVWLVLPLLALLAVGGYIAWDVYTEQLKSKQLDDERKAEEQREAQPDRHSREVKVGTVPEEDLSALPAGAKDAGLVKPAAVGKKPPVVATSRPAPTGAPSGEAALKSLKADFAKLVDDAVAKKFRLKVSKLELELGSRGSEPGYLEDVKKLDAEVKAALAAQ